MGRFCLFPLLHGLKYLLEKYAASGDVIERENWVLFLRTQCISVVNDMTKTPQQLFFYV